MALGSLLINKTTFYYNDEQPSIFCQYNFYISMMISLTDFYKDMNARITKYIFVFTRLVFIVHQQYTHKCDSTHHDYEA